MLDASALFPWHWPDGSGSMYSMLSKASEPTRILDIGQNRMISWTNIVIAFAASGILANPRVFRFFSSPITPTKKNYELVSPAGRLV